MELRISKGALLVLVAVSIPFLVEFRTVLAFFGVDLSIPATIGLGALVVAAIVAWAALPALRRNFGKSGLA
ncbi:CbaC protein [Salinilacihabitans rarus]|uniref:CbaC protein n=1 Tax=Salinilacihabitans rarus TaxID=2961596 RepID=UPI0020C8F8B4|nr:CbaC protein [Salinilacihabitans rarus]